MSQGLASILETTRTARSVWGKLRRGLLGVPSTTYIRGGGRISRDLKIGGYCYVGKGCFVGPGVTVGNYVMFGPGVSIVGGDHRTDLVGTPVIFSGRPVLKQTKIDSDVWLGSNSIILAGVHIGEGSIVGAGAVVTKDVSAYSVVGGVPAAEIGRRFSSMEAEVIHSAMLAQPATRGSWARKKVVT